MTRHRHLWPLGAATAVAFGWGIAVAQSTAGNSGSAMGASGDRSGSMGSTGAITKRNDTAKPLTTRPADRSTAPKSSGASDRSTARSPIGGAPNTSGGGSAIEKRQRRSSLPAKPSRVNSPDSPATVNTPGRSSTMEPRSMPADLVK